MHNGIVGFLGMRVEAGEEMAILAVVLDLCKTPGIPYQSMPWVRNYPSLHGDVAGWMER